MENQKDSLSITENSDGTFLMEWDKEDQKWNWLNGKTSEEISAMMTEAIQLALKENDL
jgi:predicted RNase H-like HicB family nuclease